MNILFITILNALFLCLLLDLEPTSKPKDGCLFLFFRYRITFEEGNRYFDLGRYEEAISLYDEALAIDPNYVDALNNKGVSLDKLGK